MRCQDVERLILEENSLSAEDRAKVDAHLGDCLRCSDWREFWKAVHEQAAEPRTPGLPPGLAERVRQAARDELVLRSERQAAGARPQPGPRVPGFIWAATAAVTFLTLGFLVPAAQVFIEDRKLTLGTAFALTLVLQNTLTLFFAPVVLRHERHF
jgi:anti-sigma factor RsiW